MKSRFEETSCGSYLHIDNLPLLYITSITRIRQKCGAFGVKTENQVRIYICNSVEKAHWTSRFTNCKLVV